MDLDERLTLFATLSKREQDFQGQSRAEVITQGLVSTFGVRSSFIFPPLGTLSKH